MLRQDNYLLVFCAADVGRISVRGSARHVAQFTMQRSTRPRCRYLKPSTRRIGHQCSFSAITIIRI